jgi:hypothetical protein
MSRFRGDMEDATAAMAKDMFRPATYEIHESVTEYHGPAPAIKIEVHGIHSLPAALARLAETGHDMAPSLEVLRKVVEEQRRRKALDAAINDLR